MASHQIPSSHSPGVSNVLQAQVTKSQWSPHSNSKSPPSVQIKVTNCKSPSPIPPDPEWKCRLKSPFQSPRPPSPQVPKFQWSPHSKVLQVSCVLSPFFRQDNFQSFLGKFGGKSPFQSPPSPQVTKFQWSPQSLPSVMRSFPIFSPRQFQSFLGKFFPIFFFGNWR